ncbi:phage baseplate assembly protein V [Kiloniella sp. b19]|uniref:phage baseplate assembly protein V n=1 Tax=Kiloniella sp. GXU_MW_B19 TaxID=3141326 RepID=UPI0031DB5690
MSDPRYSLSELARRLENLITIGVVVEADYSAAKVKVNIQGRKSAWLSWLTTSAGNDREWDAPDIGEQVLVLSPSGNPANGIVLASLFSNQSPAPADSADIWRKTFADGMVMEHDRAKKITRFNAMDSEGTMILEAKNLILRTGEGGFFHLDHHGKATRITHIDGLNFETESWQNTAIVTAKPDNGYSPPEVLTDEEQG